MKIFIRVIIAKGSRKKENWMKVGVISPVNFKMQLSPDLQERLKKSEFKNKEDGLIKYKKLLDAAYPYMEDTTVLSAVKNKQGDYDVYISSEIEPDSSCFVQRLKKPKNLAKSLLLICDKDMQIAEKKLFLKIIREKVRNYEPVQKIRAIADNFEKQKSRKQAEFLDLLNDEIETRDYMTKLGGGRHY